MERTRLRLLPLCFLFGVWIFLVNFDFFRQPFIIFVLEN